MTAMPWDALDHLNAVQHVHILAQTALNTTNLQKWITDNILPLLLLGVALLLLWLGGGKGDNAGVMRRVGGVFVALAIIGLAVTNAGVNIGSFIASLFTTKG